MRLRYYGSLWRCFYTLFSLLTLDEWDAIIRPIVDPRPWIFLMFFLSADGHRIALGGNPNYHIYIAGGSIITFNLYFREFLAGVRCYVVIMGRSNKLTVA